MQKRQGKRWGSLLLVLFLLIAIASPAAAADMQVDWNKKDCIIQVTPHSTAQGHPVVYGTTFILYRVADVSMDAENLVYSLTADFLDSAVSLENLESASTAKALAKYAADMNLSGTAAKADSNGMVQFNNLSVGAYLLVQQNTTAGYRTVAPFLVSLPMLDVNDGGYLYTVQANPKTETKPGPDPGPDPDPDPGPEPEPDPEEPFPEDPVPLTPPPYIPGEIVPGTPQPPPGTITTPGTLIQTGQINWPVPVLAFGGMLLFALGWGLVYLGKEKNA